MSDRSSDGPSGRTLSLVILNERREIPRIGERLVEFGETCGLVADDVASVNLAIDELVSNVIKYAYDDRLAHQIHLTVTVDGDRLTLAIEDDGRPFNPIEAAAPDLDLPIDRRPVGGLGIFLIKTIADALAYRREGDRNILTLEKRISRRLA